MQEILKSQKKILFPTKMLILSICRHLKEKKKKLTHTAAKDDILIKLYLFSKKKKKKQKKKKLGISCELSANRNTKSYFVWKYNDIKNRMSTQLQFCLAF